MSIFSYSITVKMVYTRFCVYFISQEKKQNQYKAKAVCKDSVTEILTIALFIIKKQPETSNHYFELHEGMDQTSTHTDLRKGFSCSL